MKKINKEGCIVNADICVHCEIIYETPKGNGLRGCLCKKCAERFRDKMEHWEKYGLFLGLKKQCQHIDSQKSLQTQ